MVRKDIRGRAISPKRIAAARKAIKIARRAWMRMPSVERQRVMPAKRTPEEVRRAGQRIYPVGTYMMLNVGRKGKYTHYQFVQKTKYGWKKVRAPASLRSYEVSGKPGYVMLTQEAAQKMARVPRRAWMRMAPARRRAVMPERKGRAEASNPIRKLSYAEQVSQGLLRALG